MCFTRPYRPYLMNLAVPQTYSDMWGDWYGVFAWSRATKAKPPPVTRAWLSVQMVLGLVPTALAVIGWLVLLARSFRRRLEQQAARRVAPAGRVSPGTCTSR